MALPSCAALLLLAFSPGPVAGQGIRIDGSSADSASVLVASIVERGDFVRIDRDTTLGADARIDRDLVVVRATVRLEGRVEGSVAVLGGELFIRPGAVITGDIAVAGGAVYRSGMATIGGIVSVPPEVGVAVAPERGGYTVALTGPPRPRRLRPTGVFGLAPPLYDRVNGLTVAWGTRALLTGNERGAFTRASVSYRTEREALGGSVGLEVPIAGSAWLVAELARGAFTNEAWIRGDLSNSLAAVAAGSDARDYHESDVASVTFIRRLAQPLVEGESFLAPRLALRVSDDRSLSTGDPWKLSGDAWRVNPAISDGTVASVTAGASYAWRGITATFDGDASVEWAPPSVADFEFVRLVADGRWGLRALWDHRIDLRARAALPLGSGAAPGQRWSFVGGPGTLPTLEYGARRGDHLVFFRGDYSVPLRRIRVPVIGEPILRASQATGSAWVTRDDRPRWDQNLGGGIVFPLLEAMLWLDPASESLTPVLALALTLPL